LFWWKDWMLRIVRDSASTVALALGVRVSE